MLGGLLAFGSADAQYEDVDPVAWASDRRDALGPQWSPVDVFGCTRRSRLTWRFAAHCLHPGTCRRRA
jgi:hypothetical protein